MKVAIFGATGPLGLILCEQALDSGHSVVAIVRNTTALTEKFGENKENLEIKKIVDINNADELYNGINGCEAVLSALGAKPSFSRIDLLFDFCKALVPAMKKASISRFIFCTAMYTVDKPEYGFFVRYVLKPTMIGRNLDDFGRAEQFLLTSEECKEINFTVVKPPRLTLDPLETTKPLKIMEGQWVSTGSNPTPRANVSKFMLDCLNSQKWSKKLVAIAL